MCFIILLFYFFPLLHFLYFFFFFNDTATTEIYTLSLHDALPISARCPNSRSARPNFTVRRLEHVHVAVFPTERCLDDVVQAGQAHVRRYQQAPPDRRLRAPQPHLGLVDRRRAGRLLPLRRQLGRHRPPEPQTAEPARGLPP